ncbi:hypothetical protein KM043_009229 [Ampulex compressa]|nr:hypothetical protein KM043_009229 [Ampulex compressa]
MCAGQMAVRQRASAFKLANRHYAILELRRAAGNIIYASFQASISMARQPAGGVTREYDKRKYSLERSVVGERFPYVEVAPTSRAAMPDDRCEALPPVPAGRSFECPANLGFDAE